MTLRLVLLGSSLFIDMASASFMLPFLPDRLADEGFSNISVGILVSSFFLSSLFGYYITLKLQMLFPNATTATRWRYLAMAALLIALACVLPVLWPQYYCIMASRAIQGLCSSVLWTYSMSLAAEMEPKWGISAMAWTMAGCNLGELAGPWLGTIAYESTKRSVGDSFFFLGGLTSLNALFVILVAKRSRDEAARDVSNVENHQAALDQQGSSALLCSPERSDVDGCESMYQEADVAQARRGSVVLVSPSSPHSWAPIFYILGLPLFRILAFLLFFVSIPRSALDVVIPLFLSDEFDASPTTIGMVFGVGSVFYLIGSLSAPKLKTLAVFLPGCAVVQTHRADASGSHLRSHSSAAIQSPAKTTSDEAVPDDAPSITPGQFAGMLAALILVGSLSMSAILFMPNVVLFTVAFCAFGALCNTASVMACEELEELAKSLKEIDEVASDRVMALASLVWTLAFALGNLLGGIPNGADGQRLLMGLCAVGNVFSLFVLIPTLKRCSITGNVQPKDALAVV